MAQNCRRQDVEPRSERLRRHRFAVESARPCFLGTQYGSNTGLKLGLLRIVIQSQNLAVLWGQAQFTSLALSPTMRELVIVLTGVAVKSDYELAQHLPMAKGVGCSDKQLVAILKHGADEAYYRSSAADGLFDERERVLLAWITLVAKSPNVPDETMVEVKRVRASSLIDAVRVRGSGNEV